MVRACAAWGGVRPLFFLGTPGDPDSRCTRGGGLGLAVGWWGVEAYRVQVTCHCGCRRGGDWAAAGGLEELGGVARGCRGFGIDESYGGVQAAQRPGARER